MDAGETFTLLDVREPHELAISRLDGIVSIPMGQVPSRLEEIRSAPAPLVVICRTGGRSGQVCDFLAEKGISASNLLSGMNGWATTVDPSLPTY